MNNDRKKMVEAFSIVLGLIEFLRKKSNLCIEENIENYKNKIMQLPLNQFIVFSAEHGFIFGLSRMEEEVKRLISEIEGLNS